MKGRTWPYLSLVQCHTWYIRLHTMPQRLLPATAVVLDQRERCQERLSRKKQEKTLHHETTKQTCTGIQLLHLPLRVLNRSAVYLVHWVIHCCYVKQNITTCRSGAKQHQKQHQHQQHFSSSWTAAVVLVSSPKYTNTCGINITLSGNIRTTLPSMRIPKQSLHFGQQ